MKSADEERFGPLGIIVVLMVAAISIALTISIQSGFSLWDYPWVFPDSLDWLANGLRYSSPDFDFNVSHRAMLFPLAASSAFALQLENLLIHYGTFFYLLGGLVVLFGVRRIADSNLAIIVALFFLTSFTVLGQSYFVGSDVAATVLLSGCLLYFLSYIRSGQIKDLGLSGLFAALSVHTQYLLPIVAPVFLFIFFKKDRIKRLFRSWQFYRLALLVCAVAFLPLVPRLLEFQVLYEEGVQHGSLVELHFYRFIYYFAALPAIFSIPVVLLAAYGGLSVLRSREKLLESAFMLTWIGCIFVFFACFYTWKDRRFLIYLSVPLWYFSALGLRGVVVLCQSAIESMTARRLVTTGLVAIVFLFNYAPPTLDPFDLSIALTPTHSFQRSAEGDLELVRASMKPFHLYRLKEGRSEEVQRNAIQYSSPFYDPKLKALLGRIRDESIVDKYPNRFFAYEQLSNHEWYIVANRNRLYFRGPIRTVNRSQLISALEDGPALVVSKHLEDHHYDAITARQGQYRLGIISKLDFRDEFKVPEGIKEILADEFGDKLVNGIVGMGDDWAASAHGSPIRIVFEEPTKYKNMVIHLFDLDSRYYKFSVSGLSAAGEQVIYTSPVEGDSGAVSISLPDIPLEELRIVGHYNSNEEVNPANKILHLMEVELEVES